MSTSSNKKFILDIGEKVKSIEPTLRDISKFIKTYFANNVFAEYFSEDKWNTLTYKELFRLSDNVAKNISSQINNESKYIALEMTNSPYWFAIFWGIVQSGHTPILLKTSENEYKKQIHKQIKWEHEINDVNYKQYLQENTNKLISNWSNEVVFISSGTTGIPKIITHNGLFFFNQIKSSVEVIRKCKAISLNFHYDQMRLLAVLPFYHIFGFIVLGIWFGIFGRCLVFANDLSPQTIQKICVERKVTHFFATPMIWDKLASNILENAKREGKEKTFLRTIKFSLLLQRINLNFGLFFARRLFKNVRNRILGNSLSFLISGGAKINKQTLYILNGIGYTIHNGYGLTECGIIGVNLSTNIKNLCSDNVGTPFTNIQWRINENKNLEIKNINSNDWYLTNDIAEFKHKKLSINGRLDNVIIKSDGENICLEQLENRFNISSLYTVAFIGVKQRSGYHKLFLLVKVNDNLTQDKLEEIIKDINKQCDLLSIHEKPSKLYLVDNLPFDELKKINHQKLLKLYETNQLHLQEFNKENKTVVNISANLDQKTLLICKECFANVFKMKIEEIKDDTNFISDLGGSSIDYYELLNMISTITKKEIKLQADVVLLTPVDFCIYLTDK